MADIEAIRLRIKKLLALSLDKGASENEAMAAGALAAKLIARYGVEVAVGEHAQGASAPTETFERYTVYRGKGPFAVWQARLADAVCDQAKLSWCYCSGKQTHTIDFIGPLDEVTMAGELLTWLISEVRRLQAEANEREECPKLPQYERGGGRKFWNGWRVGCATRIRARMSDARKEMQKEMQKEIAAEMAEPKALGTSKQTYALAIKSLDTRISRIDEWLAIKMKAEGERFKAPVARSTGAGDGYQKGYAAGAKASISSAKRLT